MIHENIQYVPMYLIHVINLIKFLRAFHSFTYTGNGYCSKEIRHVLISIFYITIIAELQYTVLSRYCITSLFFMF